MRVVWRAGFAAVAVVVFAAVHMMALLPCVLLCLSVPVMVSDVDGMILL